ncbi:MAG: hypothetical protein MJ211_14345 [Bacteroidales bacterium]|nr:hypothetical protein [Bacteroidales bacterium]
MKILRDDNLIRISFDEKTSILETNWKQGSFEKIEIEKLKGIIIEISNFLAEYKPQYYLANQWNRGIVYTVDIQSWIADKLVEGAIKGNIKKCAIIQSEDFIVNLSNEQTLSEAKTTILNKFFVSREKAIEWLIS